MHIEHILPKSITRCIKYFTTIYLKTSAVHVKVWHILSSFNLYLLNYTTLEHKPLPTYMCKHYPSRFMKYLIQYTGKHFFKLWCIKYSQNKLQCCFHPSVNVDLFFQFYINKTWINIQDAVRPYIAHQRLWDFWTYLAGS